MSAGHVVFASHNGAMLVVKHVDGYALVEMLGDEGAIAVGDAVSGDWDALGGEPICCRGSRYDAFFQGTWASPDPPVSMARDVGGG
jgi:hypothetical protein